MLFVARTKRYFHVKGIWVEKKRDESQTIFARVRVLVIFASRRFVMSFFFLVKKTTRDI